MKIKFKKKRLYTNLLLGLIWSVLGVISLLGDDNLRWIDYGYLIIGTLYIGHYLYDLINQYLIIKNGSLHKNILYGFTNKINLNEIKLIKKNAGNYTLKTETNKFKINTELIEERSLIELNKILGELNLQEG